MLSQYSDQFAKTDWGANLASYFKYRAINSKYAMALANPAEDHPKAQESFLKDLQAFVKDHPKASDTADALWQLGNGTEFAADDDGAIDYYQQLVKEFPDSAVSAKANGALRRLESKGRNFHLVGTALGGTGKIDAAQFRGKVLLVNYWATWCEPCKSEMPKLAALRQKYGPAGFEILSISLDANADNAANVVKANKIAWPQIHEEGSMDSMPAIEYGIISLPYMMLVDADGRVINKNLQSSQLEAEVEKAMTKQVANRPK
jgi:thiol-disulfide isomerase/thioredoxin